MNRLLLGVLICLPAMEAGEVETALAAVRQRLRVHGVAQRRPSGLHQRAALVSGALGETAAALDAVGGSDAGRQLGYLRERLLTTSRIAEADFASIDAKLAGLGLPDKLEAWRASVRHYRERLAEVNTVMAALAADGSSLSSPELRRRLAALKARLRADTGTPVRETVQGARLPAARLLDRPVGVPALAADDAPTPGDLAESRIVLLTPEIRARAASLGGDATALYDWVATHTEYVPYPGLMQDSLSTLWSHRGNDFDQATLLIALLRASGIPARYVSADVTMPRADVREWMGVKDETLILDLFSRIMDYSLFPSVERTQVVATRVWVEAYLDTGGGRGWMAMDPARKRRSFQPGILLQRPPYDRMVYLKAQQPVLPGELYLDALRAEFHKKYPGRGFNEVPCAGSLLAPAPRARELPYPVVKLHFRASEVPAIFQHRVLLTVSQYVGQTTYLTLDAVLPEVSLRRLTLTFNPATSADQQVVTAFGGIENTPAAVVNLIPEFRVGDQVVATGRTPVPLGATLSLNGRQVRPGEGAIQYVNSYRHMFTAGETAAIVLGAHLVNEELVAARISSFLDRLPAASAAEATGRLLEVAVLRYLDRVEADEQRLGDALQFRFYPSDEIGYAIAFASLEPQNLFDRPFVVTPGRLQIHAWPTCLPYVDLNRSDHTDPALRTVWQLHNDATSALEHEVWEELVMIPSISTIKVLQAAIRDNVPIRTITRANAGTEIGALDVPQSVKDSLRDKINQNATLTVPQRPVTIGTWRGTGWIEEFPDWEFNYIIFDFARSAPGGDTGGAPALPRPPAQEPGTTGQPGPVQNTTCSDPVNVANGNLFEQVTDYTLATPGPDIVFQRTYSSLSLAEGPLGPGWRHNYLVSLRDSGNSIVLQDGSGAMLNFRLVSGDWVSPPGYNLKLTKDAQGYLLRTRNGQESRFDMSGILQSIADRNRNTLQFAYEAGRLRRITDQAGRGVTLSYDSQGRLTALEDFSGRRVTYEFDAAGHLAAATNAGGHRTVYAYHAGSIYKNLLQSVTTPEGSLTSFQYYGNGKVARVNLAGGQSMSFVYLPLRNETHVIDARGLLTSYQFNALGNVTREWRPDGSVIDRVYNADAKIEAQTDAAGYTTRYTYDSAGNLTSVTDALGHAIRFSYDPALNLVTSILDAGGNLTRFEYDSRGNLARSVQPLGVETRFTWDDSGNVTSVTDAEGNSVTITYDELGNPVAVRDALGNITRREFDWFKRMTRGVDALGGQVRLEYDALDRVVRQLDQLGRISSVTYDRDGRLSKFTDPAGRTTSFRHDAMDHLAQVTDALGQVTQYGYATPDCGCAASANLSLYRDASGLARSQAYDFLDRLVSTTDPLGNTALHGYDAQGNLARRMDANGNLATFEYDPLGRLTGRVFSDGSGARLAYDANHNLIGASNQHVTYTFTYDAMNRLKTFTDSRFNKTLTYDYDRLGRRTSLTDSEGGVFVYSWDAASRIKSVRNPAGATAEFTYDALGRRSGLAYSSGAVSGYQYDAAGRTTAVTHPGTAGFAYSYDDVGNPVSVTDGSGVHEFRYDQLSRLVGAAHPSLPVESYRYDGAGNRLASSSDPGYTYDAAGRLVAGEGAAYLYDNNGSPVRKTTASGTTTYTWNMASQLVRIGLPDGGVVTYKYDPLGRRIEKNVNGVTTAYLYDLSTVLLELDSGGAMRARYTHGPGVDQPLMMERGGQVYFYHLDGQFNVARLTDASGNAVCSYSYDSFGRGQPCQDVANPYRFAGREYDSESGLYYMRARYYDPSLGRFLSADPLDLANLLLTAQENRAGLVLLPAASAALVRDAGMGALRSPQQLNPYSYALNNPAAFRDPSGLRRCSVVVTMAPEPWEGSPIPPVRGTINDFWGWIDKNNYRVVYREGNYAAIIDKSTRKLVGSVSAAALGLPLEPFSGPPES